jgi:hypothetical protein
MSFSFGFSGDDVGDDHELVAENGSISTNAGPGPQFVGLPAEEHALKDLVGTCTHVSLFVFPISVASCHVFSDTGAYDAIETQEPCYHSVFYNEKSALESPL